MAKRKKKKINIFSGLLKIITVLILLIIIMVPVFIGAFIYFNSPVTDGRPVFIMESDAIRLDEDGNYIIDIRRGESAQSVGMRLERAAIISNRYFWNLLCRLDDEPIKSGTYRIEMPATQMAIHRVLVSGKEILHRVTIPEGATIKNTARLLEEAGICSAENFLASCRDTGIISEYGILNTSMEGYLFPDTYYFPGDYPAELTVRKMADNFFTNLENIDPLIRTMSMRELNEKVIIASIVEREYRVAEEASLMAGVFYNRIRINMALQSCATVVYIITDIQNKPHPNILLFADLEIVNPYNTYMYPGLPPGPISAPGNVALRAAINPQTTGFLYFRLEDVASGRHYFSRTYDEHIVAGQLITKPSWR
ncbi:MAG: endolytic transglycosylase MltG [Treponema sp.]|nr:endolytic transglycosylase MltG [Treponema sp.]